MRCEQNVRRSGPAAWVLVSRDPWPEGGGSAFAWVRCLHEVCPFHGLCRGGRQQAPYTQAQGQAPRPEQHEAEP